jgi:hypothetical protein
MRLRADTSANCAHHPEMASDFHPTSFPQCGIHPMAAIPGPTTGFAFDGGRTQALSRFDDRPFANSRQRSANQATSSEGWAMPSYRSSRRFPK